MAKKDNPTRIFVVEDDAIYARLVKYVAEMNPDHEVHWFKNGKECIRNLYLKPEIVSLDYSLPDTTGKEVLKAIKKFDPRIEVIILSGQQDVGTAVGLLREGAYDYITKDEETKERLYNAFERVKKRLALEKQVATLQEELGERYQFSQTIKGASPAMLQVFRLVEKAAKTSITVSITGETGTGKEVAAKSIHYNSDRKKGNFVAINVSAIPGDLLESELFGYEKGAFTGATTRKIGKFEMADKGTLFLDEIGEMDIHLQAKLLRALQEREITRVGGNKPIKFDARIIVATHRDLSSLVVKGKFREDLYYRLLGLPIHLPPLRERGKDILILAKFFLDEFTKSNKLGSFKLTTNAKNKLLNYHFPGNVRELKAIMELASVMASDNKITQDDIQFNSLRHSENFLKTEMTMKKYTLTILAHFLRKYNRNVLLVAEKLALGKSTIYRLLKENEDFFEAQK